MVRQGGSIYEGIADKLLQVDDVKNRSTLAGSMLRQLPGEALGVLFDYASVNAEPETLMLSRKVLTPEIV